MFLVCVCELGAISFAKNLHKMGEFFFLQTLFNQELLYIKELNIKK